MESSPQTESPRVQRFPGLDGLRGVAAALVLLNHMSLNHLYLAPGLDFIGLGKPAVYLFFQLSAFLLTSQSWLWSHEGIFEVPRWVSYLVARIFRVWPLFLAYVLVSFATTRLKFSFLGGRGIPESITAGDAWEIVSLQQGWGTVLWTIPVEFKFYLLLPVLVVGLALLVKRATGPSLLITGAAAAACFAFIPRSVGGASPVPFLGVFLSGVFGAILHQRLREMPSRVPARFFEVMAWLAVVVLILISPSVAKHIVGRPVPGEYLARAHVLSSGIWFVLIIGMLNGDGTMRRLLDSKWLIRLGTISYSLYLCHMAVLQIVVWPRFPLSLGMRAWLAVAGALAVATLSFLTIEVPGQRLGARIRRLLSNGPAARSTGAGDRVS